MTGLTNSNLESMGRLATLAEMRASSANAARDGDAKLDAAAREFESLFVQMLLKSMRAASLASGAMDNRGSELYLEMFDREIATNMSESSSLGIAELLVQQLSPPGANEVSSPRQGESPTAVPPARITNSPESAQLRPDVSPATAGVPFGDEIGARAQEGKAPGALDGGQAPARRVAHFESPAEFVQSLWPEAQAAAERLGVTPDMLLAQSALETGWGQHIPQHADGSSTHNLFGIKASSGWSGETVTKTTLEYVGGIAVQRQERFRAYASFAASFADFADLVGGSSRYREALNQGSDARAFFDALHRGGYATDPRYAQKAAAIAGGETLQAALAGRAQS